MADPARKLTMIDQALIHLIAYLAMEWPHDTWQVFRLELEEILPRANRGMPLIEDLAAIGDDLLDCTDARTRDTLRQKGQKAIARYHQARYLRAKDALKAAE